MKGLSEVSVGDDVSADAGVDRREPVDERVDMDEVVEGVTLPRTVIDDGERVDGEATPFSDAEKDVFKCLQAVLT